MAGDFGRGIPDSVPGIIRALALGVQSILLDAIGIDIEHIGVAAVVEGIEPQAYLVVVVNQLAAQHAGTYLLRLSIERQKNGIEILVGVTEVSFRALGDGLAIMRVALNKLVHLQHMARQVSRRFHILEISQLRSSLQFGNLRGTDLRRQGRRDGWFGGLRRSRQSSQQDNRHHRTSEGHLNNSLIPWTVKQPFKA